MRILHVGEVPSRRVYRTVCRNCKTEFEFEANEATFVADQRDGDYLKIKCPLTHCEQIVAVNPKLYVK